MERDFKPSAENLKILAEQLYKNFAVDITHEEFVEGIRIGNLKIQYNVYINVYRLCSGNKKLIYGILSSAAGLIPIISIIVFAIVNVSGWYLFGLPIWFLAQAFSTHNKTRYSVYLIIVLIGFGFASEFHLNRYLVFFSAVFIATQLITEIMKQYDVKFLTETLIENPKLFYQIQKELRIARVPES